MTHWIRFERDAIPGFGTLDADTIEIHAGDMFANPIATGERVALAEVTQRPPTDAGKMIALWNNFHALAAKLGQEIPPEPLYFLKANSSYLGNGGVIRKPISYDGKVIFEGELGIVIGRTCRRVSERDAPAHIFGYTCINDVTAIEIVNRDRSFAQWTRAKSFDTFGVFGPVVATGLDPAKLSVRTVLNGDERQNYPVSDMVFPPARIVSLVSHDVTLDPGDVVCCGTSLGVGSMKPGSSIEVTIEGVGTLANRYEE
ncbi:MAG: fumarylacetoacetate hydrolase family protein [Gammaproteobacteria bacterium]|nr:fumarylacetoacetate hydrolase family protein [Gammaproteobacteria bacterium]